MHVGLLALVIILPVLVISWRLARRPDRLAVHRNIQLTLGITLAIVIAIFEYDLNASGGIFEMTKGGVYEGTLVLSTAVYVHTLFSITTSIVWVGLIVVSLFKFPNPPVPNAFSRRHRFWGRIGMVTMVSTGLTAIPLYYFGFVA